MRSEEFVGVEGGSLRIAIEWRIPLPMLLIIDGSRARGRDGCRAEEEK